MVNRDCTDSRRGPIVGSAKRQHDGPHPRMDVAKNVRNTLPVETNRAGGSRLIQPKIEALAIEERKDIVKERIKVRKLDIAASRHNQQMRSELLVLLHQLVRVMMRCNRRSRLQRR